MARSLYQATVSLRDSTTGALIPLSNVRITVNLAGTSTAATIYQDSTGSSQGPRPASGATGGPNPFTTGVSGAVEFYADSPNAYDIVVHDLNVPARLTDQTFRWDAMSTDDNAFPGAKLVDASVASAKLASGIDGAKLSAGTVAGSKLTSASVNGDRLTDNTVASAKLTSVDGSKLVDATVTAAKFAPGAVGAAAVGDGTITLAKLVAAVQQALIPVGAIIATGAATADPGFAMCDGTVVSRTGTYAALFARIGTSYNTGGEAGTDFRLPDLRGRVLVGVDGAGGRLTANDLLGNSGGEEKHLNSSAESGMPTHGHADSFSIASNRANVAAGREVPTSAGSWVGNQMSEPGNSGGMAFPQPSSGGAAGINTSDTLHTHTLNGAVSNAAGVAASSPHNNMQPYQIVNYMIKI